MKKLLINFNTKITLYLISLLLFPFTVFAQPGGFVDVSVTAGRGGGISSGGNFADIVYRIIDLLDATIVLIIGLALIWFLWGLVLYIMNAGNEAKRKESVQFMTWGIVGLFVMVALWSLVYIVADVIGADAGIPYIR